MSLLEKVGMREYESSLSQMGSQLWEGTPISLRGYIFPLDKTNGRFECREGEQGDDQLMIKLRWCI